MRPDRDPTARSDPRAFQDPGEEPPLPPKLTPEGIVNLAADELKGIVGAIEKLEDMAAAAPGSVLDREDLAFELRDLGLNFDAFSMKTLLDYFDTTKDGMIPMAAFFDRVLA